jgi:hypothetical protein
MSPVIAEFSDRTICCARCKEWTARPGFVPVAWSLPHGETNTVVIPW